MKMHKETVVEVLHAIHSALNVYRSITPTETTIKIVHRDIKPAKVPRAIVAGQSWWQRLRMKFKRPRGLTWFMSKEEADRLRQAEEQAEIDEIAAMINSAFASVANLTGAEIDRTARQVQRERKARGQADRARQPSATSAPSRRAAQR